MSSATMRRSSVERATRQAGVEIIARLLERGRRQARGRVDDPVLDMAIRVDQHDQGPAWAERDEFDVADRAVGLRRQHEAGRLRQAGQHGTGLGQRILQAAARGCQRRRNRLALILGEFTEVQQAVDEQTEPLIASFEGFSELPLQPDPRFT